MKQIYYVIQTLLRGRGSNLIKVVSLGLGLTMSILLFSRVAYEQSFDTCFKDYDNLYQVWSVFTMNGERMKPQEANSGPVAGAILENFPQEVEAATSVGYWPVANPLYNGSVRFDDGKVVADSLFFRTLGIEVLSGNPEQDLMQPDVIYLSERFARKIFGDEDPIGKVLSYDHQIDLTVRGTYATLPNNATIKPEAVVSMPSVWTRDIGNYSWSGGDSWTEYIRFRPGADHSVINKRIDAMIDKYRPEEDKKMFGYTAFIQPIRDTYRNEDDVKRMTLIMSVMGVAILFIAALNYVLISISSLSRRAKSVGVHKCSGAGGGTIFGMFLLETAFVIVGALLLMGVLLYNFRDFVEDTASAKLADLFAPERIWVSIGVVAVLFVVGGVLPGRLFAGIPVTQVFRRYTEGKKGWKRPLLFVQFAGVAFICGLMCMVMFQYQYVMSKELGYNPERLAVGNMYTNKETCDAAYQFFKGLPYVEAVSNANSSPVDGYSGNFVENEAGKSLFSTRYCYNMRSDYPEMMGMTFKAGRMAHPAEIGQTQPYEAIVNETFVRMMHWGDDAVGRIVHMGNATLQVAGVLKDFQIRNLMVEPMPFMAICHNTFYGTIHLRLKEPFAENLQKLNDAVKEAYPDRTIDFASYETKVAEQYNSVRVFRNATLVSAVVMFFIMLMGLIGYTSDEVQRRSKEIAIRKVNGAEASSILELLSRDVLYVAVPAVLLGILASWYVNTLWMDMFADKAPFGWPLYALVGIVVLAFIVSCVLWKSWRVANENPVNSIKSE
ncbi:MAG: ABC transporter permease [Bacteroides sp.]|nr:ABC transporter permease [Bacteroides sp.]